MWSAEGFSRPGRRVYLDTAAGGPLHPAARQAYLATIETAYADPRQAHHSGRTARLVLDNARAAIAEAFGVEPDAVRFTASGAEAVNRGLLGLLATAGESDTVVRSAVETGAVLAAVRRSGISEHVVPVDAEGRLALRGADLAGASVVACQSANPEIGTLQPLADLAGRPHLVPLFVDATASAGRLPLPGDWDVVAASAHTWGGPAGVGVLLVRPGATWQDPDPWAGLADPGSRGVLSLPSVFAAAAALQAVVVDGEAEAIRQHSLTGWIRRVAAQISGVTVLGHPSERLPHLVTLALDDLPSTDLVHALDDRGFEVARGAGPSRVLDAIGMTTRERITVSLGSETTEDDVERFVTALPAAVADLRGGR